MQTPSDIVRYGSRRAEDVNPVQLAPSLGASTPKSPEMVQLVPALEDNPEARAVQTGLIAEYQEPEVSFSDSFKAGLKTNYIVRVAQWYEKPHFEPDTTGTWNTSEYVNSLPFQVEEAEREWLLTDTNGRQDADWKVQRIKEERAINKVAGANPVVGTFLTSLVDTVQIGMDIASGGLARGFRLGKIGAAAIASTSSLVLDKGLTERVAPVEASSVVLNMLMNGAAGAYAHAALPGSPKGITKVDPTFPDVAIKNAVGDATAEAKVAFAKTNPDIGIGKPIEFFQPTAAIRDAKVLGAQVEKHFMGTQFEELASLIAKAPELESIRVSINPEHAKYSDGARGFFASGGSIEGGNNLLWFKQGVEGSTPLHELVHATLDARIHASPKLLQEVKALQRNILTSFNDSPIAKMAARQPFEHARPGSDIANAAFYKEIAGMDTREFVSYVYTSPTFRALLDKHAFIEGGLQATPVNSRALQHLEVPKSTLEVPDAPKGLTMLQKVQDFFSRVLGLSEKNKAAFQALLNERNDVLEYNNHLPKKYSSLDDQLRRIMRDAFENSDIPVGTPGMYDVFPTIQQAAESVVSEKGVAAKIGGGLEWSLHKSLSKFSSEVANILVSSPTKADVRNASAAKDAVHRGWRAHQYKYEDAVLAEMKDRGFGLVQRATKFSEGLGVYRDIQKEIQQELARRQDAARAGGVYRGENGAIAKLADLHSVGTDAALKDAVRSGVLGATDITASAGYFNRHWDFAGIEKIQDSLTKAGATLDEAKAAVIDLLDRSTAKANPDWDKSLTHSIGRALYERARKKAYYEDAGYVGHMGLEAVQEVRTMLDNLGIPVKDKERVLEFMVGQVDEAGKVSSFKRRIDLDSSVELALPNGNTVTYLDMVDQNLNTLLERYMDNLSGRVGLAEVGLKDASSIDKLKLDTMQTLKTQAERDSFNELFDNTVKALLGMPTGENMNSFMRASSALTQMVGLKWSGLYQLTEVANISAKYGLAKTFKHTVAQLPVFKQMFGEVVQDRAMATSLREVLTDYSSQDIRMRPLLQRYEDGFSMPLDASITAMLTQTKQVVPYMNALKWIHKWTARTASNAIVDTVQKAVKGDVKSAEFLATYGMTPEHLSAIKSEIVQHGLDTSKWSDDAFNTVRTPLLRLMDDAVLRTKLGETPAFAQFSSLGKFLFTFRNFTLASHNKLLSGTLQNQGFTGMVVLIAHQLPLAMLAVHAKAGATGKQLKEEEAVQQALAQMGAWGGFSDMFSIISGKKRDIGTPGLIGIDKMVGLVSAMGTGKLKTETVLNSMPLVAASPVISALQHLKE